MQHKFPIIFQILKKAFQKKQFGQLRLILNLHILKQIQLHLLDNEDHVFSCESLSCAAAIIFPSFKIQAALS